MVSDKSQNISLQQKYSIKKASAVKIYDNDEEV